MTSRRDPVPRAREAWLWLGSLMVLGILGSGVAVAAVSLWEHIDIRQLAPRLAVEVAERPPLPEEPMAPAMAAGSFDAVLLRSEASKRFFPDSSYYDDAWRGWRDVVSQAGGRVREVTTATELAALSPDELLVLPEALCLSSAEVRGVLAHLRRGGSVVSNWAVGARNEKCAWRGWGVVQAITGALDVREIPARKALFFTVPGGLAVSPGLDPGTRIELRPDPSLALWGEGPHAFWSDWALNPAPDESGGGADVAVSASRTEAGGRSVWLGLRLDQAATPRDSVLLRRVVLNGIAWAAGKALAAPAPWPDGRRAALVVSLDVESDARNAIPVARMLQDMGVPGTFFVVSRAVQSDRGLADALTRAGEVGSHTEDHTVLGGLTLQEQAVRLRRAWSDVAAWSGKGPAGLRPPEEAYDSATLEAWQAAGGRYVAALNDARTASPDVYRVDDSAVVLLPRILKDDYNVVVQDGTMASAGLEEAFLSGLAKLRSLGGLALLTGHTQILNSSRRVAALRAVLDSVETHKDDWWVATGADVASWWLQRAGVRVTMIQGGDSGEAPDGGPTAVEVEAPDGPVHGLWIDVVLPYGPSGWTPLVDGRQVDFSSSAWGMSVNVGDVAPGQPRRIRFVPTATSAGR